MRFLYCEISTKNMNHKTFRIPEKLLENYKPHVEKVYCVLFKYLLLDIYNSF